MLEDHNLLLWLNTIRLFILQRERDQGWGWGEGEERQRISS